MVRKRRSIAELKQELETTVSILLDSTRRTLARIAELDQYEHSGSASAAELAKFRSDAYTLMDRAFGQEEKLVEARRDLLGPRREGDKRPTKEDFKTMIEDLREYWRWSESVYKTLEKREAVFRKYNLPKRVTDHLGRSDKPMEIYLGMLGEYVRVTWQEPSKKSREFEKSKSLVDWIIGFDKSVIMMESSASTEMRDWFNEIGSLITRFLVEYFLMISDSFKEDIDVCLNETEAVIKCLSIEESSAVVAGFVASIQFCREKIHQAKDGLDRDDDDGDTRIKQGPRIRREDDLFHLIVLEIMKMEVQFQYPIHVAVDGVFFDIVNTSEYRAVFKDKVERISAEIRQMKIESWCCDKDPRTEFYEEVLRLGVPEVWKDLDLHKYKRT